MKYLIQGQACFSQEWQFQSLDSASARIRKRETVAVNIEEANKGLSCELCVLDDTTVANAMQRVKFVYGSIREYETNKVIPVGKLGTLVFKSDGTIWMVPPSEG